jgi:uncharacterized membrane protein
MPGVAPTMRNAMSRDAAAALPPMTLDEFRKRRKAPRNVIKEVKQNLSPLDKLALLITTAVGTRGFFFIIFGWTVIWLGWNLVAPKGLRFDPAPAFVMWLFISNLIQILLMPLIMVGQNVQGAQSEARAEHDLEVNVKAEDEIEVILQHLEYQNAALIAMMRKLDCDVPGLIAESTKATASTRPPARKPAKAATAKPKTND